MSEVVIEDNKIDESKKLESLKKKADLMGIKYPSNIGIKGLKTKVDAHVEDLGGSNEVTDETSVGPNKTIYDLEQEARSPMLCIVTDLDPKCKDILVETINVGNKFFKIGCMVQKDKEQLIPKAIVEALRAKTMVGMVDEQHAVTKRPTGNKRAKTSKRYAVQVLDANPKVEDYK